MCIANDQAGIDWSGRGYVSDSFSPRRSIRRLLPCFYPYITLISPSPAIRTLTPLSPLPTNTARPYQMRPYSVLKISRRYHTLPSPFCPFVCQVRELSKHQVKRPSLMGPRRSKAHQTSMGCTLFLQVQSKSTHGAGSSWTIPGHGSTSSAMKSEKFTPPSLLCRTYRWDTVQNV